MAGLRIGQVAERAGVGVETVRFYERKGLIDEPPRRKSGYRQYAEDVVPRIRFIRRAGELGFSLREIQELLELRADSTASAEEVRDRTEAKVLEIDGRIADLERMKRALAGLTARCTGEGPVGECPILEALEADAES
jgi:Hg(II)-responsive transcriptional regulator